MLGQHHLLGVSVNSSPLVHVNMHCLPMVNARAEAMTGLFKEELINRLGPWKFKDQVERKSVKWADWYNTKRPLGPQG